MSDEEKSGLFDDSSSNAESSGLFDQYTALETRGLSNNGTVGTRFTKLVNENYNENED
ncbi:hypothetical protein [Clostridium sardiniense]|uniref:hypothetical protein n=1 Tax=Clostridium sardiniense TaxID=29369 RepID=UPI0019598E1C|nr:hypothetical protein [Clostridium sardiniense]MBM7835004.1 hypothetical protein [Clostridium sardiniense]